MASSHTQGEFARYFEIKLLCITNKEFSQAESLAMYYIVSHLLYLPYLHMGHRGLLELTSRKTTIHTSV